ncbi:asialoglycoprotein receptor 1-like isoform X1 [Perca fluviatilis]|uniref:asialoglycoprotein receptor 1-like isoform X1 n=1 Tax=Perca fluviatilis TaxID=8168 RepID=UPI001965B36E|nr:asialoglycoprotein receptor 1-like isoform X1 [Perca fluviatilis]
MGLRIYFTNRNLNDKFCVLENQITDLTAVNQNVSRAQWSIDEYCPKENNVSERQCRACQKGWMLIQSTCYLSSDRFDQKTWEEAREDCRARSSDLAVVHNKEDENVLRRYSRHGSWIGLRAEGGRWKWIDGSDLTESVSYRIQEPRPAADGQCAFTNVKDRWTSESCAERKRWICEKKPLSV